MIVVHEPQNAVLAFAKHVRHSGPPRCRDGSIAKMTGDIPAEELLHAVAARRDRAAFGMLVDYFAPRLRSFLRRGGLADTEIDDIVQEAMLKVWRRAEQFNAERGNASTWIFTIARNERINVLRREARPQPDPLDPAMTPEAERPVDERINDRQDAAQLRTAMADLPSEQAEVLHLSFFEELSHSEISERLDLPLGTIKSRIRLAVNRLRGTLETPA